MAIAEAVAVILSIMLLSHLMQEEDANMLA